MFPNQVIYTANGDLTTLYAILNAVAMICRENATIWGFALMAATWSLFSMTAVAGAGAAAGGVGPDLARRAFALIIPFCLAICLTSSSMKSTVTVESGLAGATTTVANVPVLISVVPATASLISKIVGDKLHTAMQSTGTDYDAISAKQQGFINPLKTLLTSRIAILRLGGIASEVNSLLGTCLNADAGVNYADIANHVLFAGNLPAAQAGPAPITVWTPLGAQRTSIGVLLAEAAQNTSAFVTDIKVGSNHIATCADAAAQVGQDIDTALNSDQFKRVVQGAVNAADQPNAAGDYTIDGIAAAYAAVRSADSITGGTGAQTDVELINLLFAELVRNDLECLRADGTNKSTCLAMAVQSNEIERNNIQAAANGFDALMYAGAFANQITAVIIGLGPVLVLFMMFSGAGAARNMKVAAHMIVWPLLIMNVGAELINGMMYISVSGFLRALAQGGVINQSNAVEVYKNFSLQIGTASHLMATLPILMSTIFALGQSAALVRLGESMGSGRKEDPKPVDPPPAGNAPAATGSSVAMAGQASIGAPPFAPGTQFGGMRHDAAQGIASAQLKMQALSDGADNLAGWKDAFATGDFGKVGVSAATGNAVRTAFQAQGAADGNPLAQSRSLAHSVDSVMRGDGDARPDAAEARALHRSAGIQKQYADTLSTSASASDAAGEAVRKSAGLPALSARIGGADIAHQMRTNPAFRQFQLNEGHAFGNLPAARRYLEQARQDTGEGGEALARHRAALSMATDGQAAPEDRMRAHQYLLGTSSAMLAGQVAAPETRPAGGVAEAAPLIRPASGADDDAGVLQTYSGNELHQGGLHLPGGTRFFVQPETMEPGNAAPGGAPESAMPGAAEVLDGLGYAMEGNEPQMLHTAQWGGHYYLPLMIGKMVGLSPERIQAIAAFSQFPDQVAALDGYTNGVRSMLSKGYAPAEAGEFSERAIHALNGKPVAENLAFYQKEIAKYRNDDARVGIAMHGLVDSIFHSHMVNGVAVTYKAPMGHGLHGSNPDYISEDQTKAAAGALIRAFETVGGVKLTGAQRAGVMSTVNQAVASARSMTDGEVRDFHDAEERYGHGSGGLAPKQNERMELNFRKVVNNLMAPSMQVLSPSAELPSPFTRDPITPEGSVEEASRFLGISTGGALDFTTRGMQAARDIMTDYASTSGDSSKYKNLDINDIYDTKVWSLKGLIPGYRPPLPTSNLSF
ncbi:conjugal transfer protein TraG N-terminal domain-containing protein [Massilia sp. CT11-137]|uniref:conjugal transfer protein TraG N-terminal domain-containing protein n=1 Tax=Massilia sp. CT11-137 TaxID=3393901 RepID=UPI0039A783EA